MNEDTPQTTSAAAATGSNTNTTSGKPNPPQVITVDTNTNTKEEDDKPSSASTTSASQARTPKHANKTKENDDGSTTAASGGGEKKNPTTDEARKAGQQSSNLPPRGPPAVGASGSAYPQPRPFEGRTLGGSGAFQPHEPRRHQLPPPHSDQYYTRSPMQISPGGAYDSRTPGGFYDRRGVPGGYPPHGPPPPPPPGYYDQRGYEYGPPQPLVRPPPGHPAQGYEVHHRGALFPPPGYPHQSYGGYHQSDPRSGFAGGPPPVYPPGGQYPPGASLPQAPDHYPRDQGYPPDPSTGSNSTFSRAVSSSFDRSVKEKPTASGAKPGSSSAAQGRNKPLSPGGQGTQPGDASMASDDISWKQLKQVHSIDDSAIQEHLGLKKGPTVKTDEEQDDDSRHPPSNSSSLTNSPTEGAERRIKTADPVVAAAAAAAAAATSGADKQQSSSLDELSSVASAQAPMDTSATASNKAKSDSKTSPPSPGTEDSASLDLMKCSSGSSGLLHLAPQQRNEGLLYDGKRGRDEERGDSNTGEAVEGTAGEEIRRAPSDADEKQPNKKVRIDDKQVVSAGTANKTEKNKASPLSITCSPSADANKKQQTTRKLPTSKPKVEYYASPHLGEHSFYDRPPAYSYSMDSAPSIPRDGGLLNRTTKKAPNANPTLPPRPGSSSSSTITPGHMQIDSQDPANAVVASIPSWEIHAQDSFGAGSVGGGQGLANNFSFQDYPMLSASESNLGADHGTSLPGPPAGLPMQGGAHGGPHLPPPGHPPLESRNQSFDGGHYHGGQSFHRTDSMDVSYGGRPGGPGPVYQDAYGKPGHTGPFPPHAPSWGTAGSAGSHPSYQQGHPPGHHPYSRMGDYPILRNYSQESAHRTSPPPGPGGPPGRHWGRPPSNFEPPPEFAAPHNPHLNRRPPPAVYIMSSQGTHSSNTKRGSGVFSWSKEDDLRLAEVMKKYKNPRDWEPVAKEHGMGKSAKECHERWIRYLKPGVRKGQWTDQEDAIVIEAVTTSSEQPFTRWSDLAQRLPGRVGKQIRDRWVNHLNPNINHLPFSRDDDLLLWEGHKKLGKRWVEISTKFFNSTRSENHIKNRWYSASFKKFISNEYGPDAYSGGKSSKGKDNQKKKVARKEDDDPALHAVGV